MEETRGIREGKGDERKGKGEKGQKGRGKGKGAKGKEKGTEGKGKGKVVNNKKRGDLEVNLFRAPKRSIIVLKSKKLLCIKM